jgi:DegV family protein with EDD domain
VHFGERTYLERVDITTSQFFQMLATSTSLPTTSQPSVSSFVDIYRKLSELTDSIISIHLSAKLSGTYASAVMAKEAIGGRCRIEVVDSQWASMGLGYLALAAAQGAQQGKNLDELCALVRRMIPRLRILFFVDTLEYLQKGGRIGKAQAFLGSLLNLKPVLTLTDGEIHPVERVRTRSKALEKLQDFVLSQPAVEQVAILHSTTPDDVEAILRQIAHVFPREKTIVTQYGPIIGVHVGPGVMGAVLLLGEKK